MRTCLTSILRFTLALLVLSAGVLRAHAGTGIVVRSEFRSLDIWSVLTFPKVARRTAYTVERQGEQTVLRARADASASGLVQVGTFDPYETPVLRWRWRAENVYSKGDATRKDGDDYPIRVYVLFTYDPGRASLTTRAAYALAKRLYGEYPPHASLNYIWANRPHEKRILSSPYTDRSRMIVLRAGAKDIGKWVEEEADILSDYRAAFGEDPPREAALAIMSDADNTGQAATAFVAYIERRSRRVEGEKP